MLKIIFRALGTFQCLGRKTNFTINVCLSIVQHLWCCWMQLNLHGDEMFILSPSLSPPPPSHHQPPTLRWALLTSPTVFPIFGGGAIWSELVGWAPQWAWPGTDRKTEWEGKKERRRERAWQTSSTVGWNDSWLTVKAAASLRPTLAGLLCSAFALCASLNWLIRTDKQEDPPVWKTDRCPVGGFHIYIDRCGRITLHSECFAHGHETLSPFYGSSCVSSAV